MPLYIWTGEISIWLSEISTSKISVYCVILLQSYICLYTHLHIYICLNKHIKQPEGQPQTIVVNVWEWKWNFSLFTLCTFSAPLHGFIIIWGHKWILKIKYFQTCTKLFRTLGIYFNNNKSILLQAYLILLCLLYCALPKLCFLHIEGLRQPGIERVYWHHFSNSFRWWLAFFN